MHLVVAAAMAFVLCAVVDWLAMEVLAALVTVSLATVALASEDRLRTDEAAM